MAVVHLWSYHHDDITFRGIFAFQTQLKDQDFIMKSRQICGHYTKKDLK